MSRHLLFLALAFAAPAFAGGGEDVDKVNGSIRLRDNQVGGALSTVNGSITLDEHAKADTVETVNGSIELGADAGAHSLETVNGGISLGERARVERKLDTVNGAISLARGSEALGKVSNVNGRIRLDAAHIAGGIETVNGDVDVGADSKVEGGIFVDENKGTHWGKQKLPRIVIGPHAVVEGKLTFKREVELFVSDSAKIGAVEGAKAVTFSGAQPTE